MTSKKDELKWKKVEKLKVFWTGWKYKRSCNKKRASFFTTVIIGIQILAT